MVHTNIIYSGFWDAPLGFVVEFRGYQLYFSREFDDDADDYQSDYSIFVLPRLTTTELQQSWQDLRNKAQLYLGVIPMDDITFDPSRRSSIDTQVLERFAEIIDKLSQSEP